MVRIAAAILVLGAAMNLEVVESAQPYDYPETQIVRVTHYYATGSPMADGELPFIGAVACSFNFALGTVFITADGQSWVCLDRGRLGTDGWLDFFGFDAEAVYGVWASVAVVRP